MVMSILHRITGIALYVGTLLLVWWLVAAAWSERAFDIAQGFMGSWLGLLILVGYSWALMLHLLGGIRHFLWDFGIAMGVEEREWVTRATLVGSVLLTSWSGRPPSPSAERENVAMMKQTRVLTPLKEVRAMGSAKSGTSHFFRSRTTGLALGLLTLPFLAILINLQGASHARLQLAAANPLVALVFLLVVAVSATT